MVRRFRKSRRPGRTARRRRRTGRGYYRPRAPLNTPYQLVRRISTVMRAGVDPGAASVCAVHVLGLNTCYDPTLSVAAQQPLYFDQYMTLY